MIYSTGGMEVLNAQEIFKKKKKKKERRVFIGGDEEMWTWGVMEIT